MDFEILHEDGHYNLYIKGKFYCSADKISEAVEEYQEYMKGGNVNEA
jgi:hypothetical protein